MEKKYSVIALALVAMFMIYSLAEAPVATATTTGIGIQNLDEQMTYVYVSTQGVGNSNSSIPAIIGVFRLDLNEIVNFTLDNVTLYSSSGLMVSNAPIMFSAGTGYWVAMFKPVYVDGTYTIVAYVTWTTEWGDKVTKFGSGTVYLSSWATLGININGMFSNLKSSISSINFNTTTLNYLIGNISRSLNSNITRLMNGIRNLTSDASVGDPSFHFYYANIPVNNTRRDNFGSGLHSALSGKGIPYTMTNITSTASLETVIQTVNDTGAIVVFPSYVIPIPNDCNYTTWIIYLSAFAARNNGEIAVLDTSAGIPFKYFQYANSTTVTDNDGFTDFGDYSFGIGNGTYSASGVGYPTNEVMRINQMLGLNLTSIGSTDYKYVSDRFYNQLAGVLSYNKIYTDGFYGYGMIYTLSNTIIKLFISPTVNMGLNAELIAGDIVYSFDVALNGLLDSLYELWQDSSVPLSVSTYAGNKYNLLLSEYNTLDYSDLTPNMIIVQNWMMSGISNFTDGVVPEEIAESNALINSTDASMTTLNGAMTVANKTWQGRVNTDAGSVYGNEQTQQVQVYVDPVTKKIVVNIVAPDTNTMSAMNQFQSLLGGSLSVNGNSFKGVMQWIKTEISPSQMNAANASICSSVLQWLGGYTASCLANVATDSVGETFSANSGDILGTLSNMAKTIDSGLTSALALGLGKLAGAVSSTIKGLMGTLMKTVTTMMSTIQSVMKTMASEIQSILIGIKNILGEIVNTVSNQFLTITKYLGNLTTYLNHTFSAISTWATQSIAVTESAVNGIIGEAENLELSLKGMSGFFPSVDPLLAELESVIGTETLIGEIKVTGMSSTLFEAEVGAANDLAQTISSLYGNGVIILSGLPNAVGINTNFISGFAMVGGKRYNGTGMFMINGSTSKLPLLSGRMTFNNGVGNVSMGSLKSGLYSITIRISNETYGISMIYKVSGISIQSGVYGTYTVKAPDSVQGGSMFNVTVTLKNLRYSNGTADIQCQLFDTHNIMVYSGSAQVTFNGNGTKSATVEMEANVPSGFGWVLGGDFSGSYTLKSTVTDEYTQSLWSGATSTEINVNTVWDQLSSTWLILIIVGLAIALVVSVFLLRRAMRTIGAAMAEHLGEKME